jgi:outer membrane lipoprotein-sorting protein
MSRAMLACVATLLTLSAHAEDAAAILQKARDTYVGLKSYADRGTVVHEYGYDSTDTHTFTTYFNRAPRHFLLDFNKQGGDQYVIWGDPEAFHTWWKAIGQQTDYPNPTNTPAISMSGQNTAGASLMIPTLLYGKSDLAAVMLRIADPVLDGTEDVGGRRCHKIIGRASDVYAATGREVNVRRVTVWIDIESLLVRKIMEESKPLPGQRSRNMWIFEPQANPRIDDSRFKFTPPEPR